MKRKACFLALVLLSLTSCGSGTSSSGSGPNSSSGSIVGDDYYDKVEERAKFNKNSNLSFKEEFTNGMSDDIFAVLDAKWDAGGVKPHNGVRKRNIFYTKDSKNNGYVAIKGRGLYNHDEGTIAGSPEGGCFITKEHLGPGRYEIKMAAMPREGGITAFWTYCTTTGSEATSQNEIDIEIGGKTDGTAYESLWATTWTSHKNTSHEAPNVTDMLYLNDGEIHTYTFDWYTAYPTDKMPRIDWFIDGKLITSISNDTVPTHEMPLWIGLWFQSWAGEAQFDTDYLLIDEVSYSAFEEKQVYDNCRTKPSYTQYKPSESGIQTLSFDTIKNVNKIANGLFKQTSASSDGSLNGWFKDVSSKGTHEIVTEDQKNKLKLTASTDTTEKYHGQYINQTITEAYPNYKFDFKVTAKKADANSKGQIILYYMDKTNKVLSQTTIDVTSLEDTLYTKEITMPAKSQKLKVEFTADDGSTTFSDVSLVFKGIA